MPVLFILAIIILFITAASIVGAVVSSDPQIKSGAKGLAGITLALGVLLTFFSSANTVPVRNVGIVTSFNKPTGETTGSGLHLVAPWKKLREWDASIQTDDAKSNVRISTGAVAEVENKIRWQVKASAAPQQYNDYKGDFENMRRNLFNIEKQAAFNEAFADYNPIAQVAPDGKVQYDLGQLGDEVKGILEKKLGDDFEIHSVVIPIIHHDAPTQNAIEEYQKSVTQGRTLDQKSANADKEIKIADKLKNLPPGYSVNKCLDLAKELGKEPGYCLSGGPALTRAG